MADPMLLSVWREGWQILHYVVYGVEVGRPYTMECMEGRLADPIHPML